MVKDQAVNDLAEFFRLFGDATRLKILHALSISEMCVCDISEFLGMSQSAVSHQLKVLRQCRLVKYRREGRNVFYSLDDEHIQQIIYTGFGAHAGKANRQLIELCKEGFVRLFFSRRKSVNSTDGCIACSCCSDYHPQIQ